jgi:phenylacetate-CoA ligase
MTAPEGLLSRVRSGIPGLSWPPIVTGPLASLVALARHLEESQWLPAAEIEARQHGQLAVVAKHAAAHSPHFALRLASAGLAPCDLATPAGLQHLPVLRRREIQQAGSDFHCSAIPEGHGPLKENRTSGSTGEPVTIRRSAVSELFWRAISLRFHAWSGRDLTKRCTTIRVDNPEVRVGPNWGAPLSLLFETGPLQAIPTNIDIAEQVRLLAEFKPESLVVYPNNLDAIRRHCERRGIELEGIGRILTMSETLSPTVRTAAEAFFKARIFDCYSSAEVGIAALECPESGLYHVMAETLLMEVLDEGGNPCGPGETGRLVLTDLSNFASPVIRYDTADYAEYAGACPCGRGLLSLRRIVGRERNLLRRPDGQRYWPKLDVERYREAAPVVEHQLLQREIDLLEMKLVVETPLTAKQEADLAGAVNAAIGYPFRIRFTYFDGEIPRSASGKFEEFLCLLPDDAP